MKIHTKAGIVAALILGLATTGGCANQAPSTPSPTTSGGAISGELTGVWDATYKSALEPTVQAFETTYPGTTVKINYAGGDVPGLISTQLQANNAPDVLLTFPGGSPGGGANLNVVTMASQNKLLDVSDSSWTSTVPEEWKSEVTHEDKTYAYPGAIQGLAAIYNKTKLDELGLKAPQTLTEVYQLCVDAKKAGVYAYAQGLGDTAAGPQMLSFGQTSTLVYGPDPDFTNKQVEGQATFQDSGWKTQFEIYQKMYNDGCFGEGSLGRSRTQGIEAVAAGKALGIVDVSAIMATMKTSAPKSEFILTGIPANDDASSTYTAALPIYTIAVNAKAKNPAAATAFLDVLAEPENANSFAKGFNAIPAIPNDQFTPPAELKGFAELVQKGSFSKLPNWPNPKVQVELNEGVQSMLLGKDTPDSLAKKMQDALQP
jgi:raffinose/stachyose/melibiose transport system substrate-binding protein